MISLVVLPMMFCWFIFSRNYLKEYGSINYAIDEAYCNKIIKETPKLILRNNSLYEFDSSIERDSIKLLQFQFDLRKLHNSNDSINGIKIHLGKHMNYDVFIRLLDIINIEKTNTYYQMQNDLYILGNIKRHLKSNEKRGYLCCYADANNEFFAEKERKLKFELFIKLLKQNKTILFAFLGIVILNVFITFKFNRNRKYIQKSYL